MPAAAPVLKKKAPAPIVQQRSVRDMDDKELEAVMKEATAAMEGGRRKRKRKVVSYHEVGRIWRWKRCCWIVFIMIQGYTVMNVKWIVIWCLYIWDFSTFYPETQALLSVDRIGREETCCGGSFGGQVWRPNGRPKCWGLLQPCCRGNHCFRYRTAGSRGKRYCNG